MGQVQWSGFATRRFNDDDDDLPVSDQPAKPVRRPNTKTKPKDPQRRPKKAAAEAEGRKDAKAERAKDRAARKEKIQGLLKSEGLRGSAEAADAFVESFFDEGNEDAELLAELKAYAKEEHAKKEEEDPELQATTELLADLGADAEEGAEAGASEAKEVEEVEEAEEEASDDSLASGDPMSGLKGLRRGSRRIVLQELLQGRILESDPEAKREWQQIEASFAPPSDFTMRVVDVNRTAKGTQAGGLYRYSAMVVVGNYEGVLGWGQGKSAEVQGAVQKAYVRACSNLFPIPRFNAHTVTERAEAKYGQVKMVVYPKAAGTGIVASDMITGICKLAGIHDLGVKIHGSRNRRNAVKCLFEAFGKMRPHEELVGQEDKVVLARPMGRFASSRTQH